MILPLAYFSLSHFISLFPFLHFHFTLPHILLSHLLFFISKFWTEALGQPKRYLPWSKSLADETQPLHRQGLLCHQRAITPLHFVYFLNLLLCANYLSLPLHFPYVIVTLFVILFYFIFLYSTFAVKMSFTPWTDVDEHRRFSFVDSFRKHYFRSFMCWVLRNVW